MEKVTIIIPAYNAEKDIHRCLSSVEKQSYSNLQVLIINDGSTDQTEAICQEYCRRSNKFILLNGSHRGVSAARNLGINHASGKYLFFMDADDELTPNGIEILMKYHSAGEWIIGNYKMVDVIRTGHATTHQQYFREDIHYGNVDELPKLCISRNFNCVWGKIYQKDIIDKNGILFNEDSDYGEDLMFNADYFPFIKTFVILKEVVYSYCYRFGEGLGTRYIKDEWKIQTKFCKNLDNLCRNVLNLDEERCDQMNRFYYDQASAALDRIAEEKGLALKNKVNEIKKITVSDFFMTILEKELFLKRINRLDYFLLKNNFGLIFHMIHKSYALVKEKLYRRKK